MFLSKGTRRFHSCSVSRGTRNPSRAPRGHLFFPWQPFGTGDAPLATMKMSFGADYSQGGARRSTLDVRAMYAENWATEANALRERLIFLCESLAPARGRYEYLESRTAIGASKWKNVFIGRQ